MKKQQEKWIHLPARLGSLWCSIFFLVFFFFQTSAQDNILHSRFSIHLDDVKIHEVLDTLAEKSQRYFTYNAQLFDENKRVSLHEEEQPLLYILEQTFQDSTLAFHPLKKQIVIYQKEYDVSASFTTLPDAIPQVHIYGTVRDALNGDPLPYTNLGILNRHKGTTTNADGFFQMPLSPNEFEDTLLVSFIGYKNKKIPLAQAIEQELDIELEQDYISLQEIVIRSTDPLGLIQSALQKIDENYLIQANSQQAFYRETVKKNKNYMIYLESVLQVYKSSFHNPYDKDVAQVLKSRKTMDMNRLDTISFRLQGGVESCLQMDLTKNKPDFLQEELFPYYSFVILDMASYNNLPIYVVECTPKPKIKTPLLYGKVFIDANSLAIVRTEFGYSPKAAGKLSSKLITRKSAGVRAKPLQLSYAVQYRYMNGKYYLSHALGDLKFRVRSKKYFFASTFEVAFEMATTRIDTVNVQKIRYKKRLNPQTVLSEEPALFDETFWGNASFILPEENIQEAVKKINPEILEIALP